MISRKDAAKFFAGFVLHEIISHVFLGVSGILPYKLEKLGYTLTPEINRFIVIGWGVVFVALVYYAWFKKK